MSNRTTVILALAAGFVGGLASQRITPTPAWAQGSAPVPPEIRAHKVVLVDEAGVDRGVLGFGKKGDPAFEMMDLKGRRRTWVVDGMYGQGHDAALLPDTTWTPPVQKK